MPKIGGKTYDDALWTFARSVACRSLTGVLEPGHTMYIPEQNIVKKAKKIYRQIETYLAERGLQGTSSLKKPNKPHMRVTCEMREGSLCLVYTPCVSPQAAPAA